MTVQEIELSDGTIILQCRIEMVFKNKSIQSHLMSSLGILVPPGIPEYNKDLDGGGDTQLEYIFVSHPECTESSQRMATLCLSGRKGSLK
jgi:hypothetical protein